MSRGQRATGAACALAGFLFLGVALAPSLAGREAFVPADYWLGAAPFAFAQTPAWRQFRSNSLLGDPACLYPPQLWVLHRALENGEFPLWNRWTRAGEAMLGSGQAGPFAPTTWPILLLPWPHGFAWAALLRFGLLWLGAYLFGRSLGLARPWSVAVAVGFCAAPLFAVHFQQLPRATAHVALPWLLLAGERLARAADRDTRAWLRAALPLAPLACFALLAGYPPAALTVLFGAGLYVAVRAPWRPLGRALAVRAVAALALALGVGLAAPVLLPFLEALRDSATLADRGEGGQWTLPASALRMLWDPFAFGSPMLRAAAPWNGPENFEEAQQYVGLVPWLLAIAAASALTRLDRDDRLRAAALAALVSVAASLAFGWWPLHPLLTLVPPFSVNGNPRLLFLAQTAIPAFAALLAARWLASRPTREAPARAFAPIAAAVVVGAAALVALATDERGSPRPWVAAATATALVAALRVAASEGQRRAALWLVPLAWIADVAPPYLQLHPPVPIAWAEPERAAALLPEPLRREPAPRVAFERFTAPNLPALVGVEDVRAYSFPAPLRYDRYALDVMGAAIPMNLLREDLHRPSVLAGLERICAGWVWTSRPYEGGPLAPRVERVWERGDRLFLYRLRHASPCAAWVAADGVEHVADLSAAIARLRASLAEPGEAIVLEAGESPRATPGAAPALVPTALRWDGANRVALDVPPEAREANGWMIVRVSHDPGWRAASETGVALRVVPAQVRFLAVEVPRGTQRVLLRYAPPRWGLAWTIAGGAFSLLALAAIQVGRYGALERPTPRRNSQ